MEIPRQDVWLSLLLCLLLLIGWLWRELELLDDFEDSQPSISQSLDLDGCEPNTLILQLVQEEEKRLKFEAAVEKWRVFDGTQIQLIFKHSYPPGMRLSKNFKAEVME